MKSLITYQLDNSRKKLPPPQFAQDDYEGKMKSLLATPPKKYEYENVSSYF